VKTHITKKFDKRGPRNVREADEIVGIWMTANRAAVATLDVREQEAWLAEADRFRHLLPQVLKIRHRENRRRGYRVPICGADLCCNGMSAPCSLEPGHEGAHICCVEDDD